MTPREPPHDYEEIDGAPMREAENRAIRLLLEKERARERLVRRLKFWTPIMATGTTGFVAAQQAGLIDWLAGILVRMKH